MSIPPFLPSLDVRGTKSSSSYSIPFDPNLIDNLEKSAQSIAQDLYKLLTLSTERLSKVLIGKRKKL